MTVRVGINGFGRIGKGFVRALLAQGADLEVVAANDITDTETLAHLLKYDSVQGRLDVEVRPEGETLVVGPWSIRVFTGKRPEELAWGDLGVDVVV